MRRIQIENYLILLQVVRYNRSMARELFLKYERSFFEKSYEEILFEFEDRDKKLVYDFKDEYKIVVQSFLKNFKDSILFYSDSDYPKHLRDIEDFPLCLFYRGNIDLIHRNSVSVVGTRNPSNKAVENTKRIANLLYHFNLVAASGLAKGVDFIIHDTMAKLGSKNLIAVIGTPLSKYYPKENCKLQDYIGSAGLLISEMPSFEATKKWSFTRRNHVMSAISKATIVIEASDTSGTVSQARSTLKNGRFLFVPKNVFDNPKNSWPMKFSNEYNKIYKFSNMREIIDMLREKL